MRLLILLDRDSWRRFHSSCYQTLPSTLDGRFLGELPHSHICDDNTDRATINIRCLDAPDVAYHLVYDGEGMSVDNT